MLRNKYYVYGDESVTIPAHIHFGKYLLDRFKSYGDHVALINAATDERVTYRQLAQRTVDVALSLVHAGVRKGDVVATCSGNEDEFWSVLYGAMAAGATFSGLDVTCAGESFLHRINIAKPKILFCSPSGYRKHKEAIQTVTCIERIIILGEAIGDVMGFKEFLTQHASVEDFDAVPVNGAEDLVTIRFSSGTSGLAKGIKMTHLNTLINCQSYNVIPRVGYMVLSSIQWCLSLGQATLSYCHQMGVTLVYHHQADKMKFLEIMQDYKINVIFTTPMEANSLVNENEKAKYDLKSVKIAALIGAACDEALLDNVRASFPDDAIVYQYYGMTEAGVVFSPHFNGVFDHPPGSVGRVRETFVVKIVDINTREPLGPNRRGEICYKSPTLMKGYVDESIDYLDEEGFLKSGDIGYYDENKFFYVVDRIKDVIKYNGFTVPPAEMESVLMRHPAVREAGVVGAPHEEAGELPTAFVALEPGAGVAEEELVAFVNSQMSSTMPLAGGVRFLDELPRSGIKIDRKKLRPML